MERVEDGRQENQALTHYDDLGVPAGASDEEIREAYLKLIRLLPPVLQREPFLRRFAENQMKRVNSAFAVLSDPQRRVKYDAQLAESTGRDADVPSRPQRRSVPVRAIITLGWLICAFAGAIGIGWYVSERSSASQVPASISAAPRSQVALTRLAADPNPPAEPTSPPVAITEDKASELDSVRSELAATKAERDRAVEQLMLQNKELDFLASRIAAAPQQFRAGCARFSGVWVLPKRKITPVSSAYTPEAVDLVVSEREGGIQGRYRARYPGMGTVEAPVVHFYFEGQCQDDMVNAVWNAEGGKGEIQLRLTADTTLQLVWSLPEAGISRGPTSGTLLLVRRREIYEASNFAAPASRNHTTSLPSRIPN
ncbi:MAG: curved DNA-binding protein [Bryobacterales bacterium]|nr:curved DNA-binding protein [Bryobacterales bacterium]